MPRGELAPGRIVEDLSRDARRNADAAERVLIASLVVARLRQRLLEQRRGRGVALREEHGEAIQEQVARVGNPECRRCPACGAGRLDYPAAQASRIACGE